MAYFKIYKDSVDDQRIYDLADRIEGEWGLSHLSPSERRQLVGLLGIGVTVKLWAYADTHVTSENRLHVSLSGLAAVLNVPIGVLEKMPPSWLQVAPNGHVVLPGYCERNHLLGKDERKAMVMKRREADRLRKDKERKRRRQLADMRRNNNGHDEDNATTSPQPVRTLPVPVPVPNPTVTGTGVRNRDRLEKGASRRAVKARAAAPPPEPEPPRATRSAEEVERELEAEWRSRFGGFAAKPENPK